MRCNVWLFFIFFVLNKILMPKICCKMKKAIYLFLEVFPIHRGSGVWDTE